MQSNKLYLPPIRHVSGEIDLPGSKSISNRALLLAALSQGSTRLNHLLASDDVNYMLNALQQLDVSLDYRPELQQCIIKGKAGRLNLTSNLSELYLGNAGTAMRPLAAILSLNKAGQIILTGEPRMQERPIAHLVAALQEGGAVIQYEKNAGYPPIRLLGGYSGGNITVAGNISSQFLTALLLASPLAENDTIIHIKGELVSKPYIDLTLAMMQQFGVTVSHDNYHSFEIKGQQSYLALQDYWIEGDASSASYFLAAAAINRGEVTVRGVGRKSLQGDVHFADALAKMGADIQWGDDFISCKGNKLIGVDMDVNHIPDAAMTLAIVALYAVGKTTLRNIYNWRVKETDRLNAMSTELRKVGATVVEGEDFITITPPTHFRHAEIATYNDHRIAMCFSLLALSPTGVTILNPDCTAKTFPHYFKQLNTIAIYKN